MMLMKKLLRIAGLIVLYIASTITMAFAGRVTVSWDPNSESDLSGYKVYYGTQPNQNYDGVIDVGNVTTFTINDLQDGQTYYLAVTAYDFSGNESGFSDEVTADIPDSNNEPVDTEAPTLVSVTPMGETQIDAIFSEKLDGNSIANLENYSISPGVQVIGTILDANETIIHLVTGSHQTGTTYTLTISSISDKNGNVIPPGTSRNYHIPDPTQQDTQGPELLYVVVVDRQHIDVIFSEPVDRNDAERLSSYDIDNGVQATNARLNDNRVIAHLATTEHKANTAYSLTINNIHDLAGNSNASNSSYSYKIESSGDRGGDGNSDGEDAEPPTVISVDFQAMTQLDVVFSKALDKTTAEQRGNYSINNGIEVKAAILSSNRFTVHLLTSAHEQGVQYTLTINNVTDEQGVPISSESQLSYSRETNNDGTNNRQATISLFPNYPNPFNPETQIRFHLEESRKVELKIYNPLGQLVRTLVDGELSAGMHSVIWDGQNQRGIDVPSGMYIYTLEITREAQEADLLVDVSTDRRVRKMTLVR